MIKGFIPRLYQETILYTALKKNTLVVLPTGLGKTNIAVLLSANRLKNYPESKVLILAPTKPLCDQHLDSIKAHLNIEPELIKLFTGHTPPAKRKEMWGAAKVIISTPQGLENDVISGKIDLKNVSLLVFDEAHRGVGDYSYVFIAKMYNKISQYPRILGLTASPGSDVQKINEVCKNLFIEEIESRTQEDPDVKPYVKEIDVEYVRVDLPKEFLELTKYLKDAFQAKLESVKTHGYIYGDILSYSKSTLLELQRSLFLKASSGEKDFDLLKSVSLLAEALKIQHAIELAETQGLKPLSEYFQKIEEEAVSSKVRAVQNLVRDLNWRSANVCAARILKQGIEHPKFLVLKKIISEELIEKKDVKIIIFNQYRDSSTKIKEVLDELNISCKVFFGQAKRKETGLSQKEQKKILDEFRDNQFTCLIATSVAEEGLDIPQVDLVIFYEPIPSAIRSVQRRGRTGRQEKGRVIVLITNKTRDETSLWSSVHKEKRMHRIMADMKKNFSKPEQTKLPTEDNSDIKIHADYREKASGIIKDLSEQGVKIDLSNLEVGDYVLSERVVVEYKKVLDFVNSIIDGRLLAQLSNLKKYDRPFIVIEGEEDLYSQRSIHPNAIRGALSTILVAYGIPIIQTKNAKETAALFLTIAKKEAETGKKEFTLHSAKPLTDKEMQEYIVSSFPGIGPALSKPILKHFKSIKEFVNASEDELRKVDLIGEKKASKILDVVNKNYDD